MSSILDALNKLEQEKSATSRDADRPETDAASAAHELVGRSVLRDRVTLRITPATLLAAVGVLAVALIVLTFVVAILVTRPARGTKLAAAPAAAASALAVPVTTQPSASSLAPAPAKVSPPPATVTPVAKSPDANAAANDPAPVKSADLSAATPAVVPPAAPAAHVPEAAPATPTPTPTLTPESSSAPAVAEVKTQAAPEPAPEASQKRGVSAKPAGTKKASGASRTRAPSPERSPDTVPSVSEGTLPPTRVAAADVPVLPEARRELPGAAAARTPRSADVRVDQLPELSPQDQARFGFARVRINMSKPAGPTNPQGFVILTLVEQGDAGDAKVNRTKFYEGQLLQHSTLRLFKVEADRIGIEDTRTSEKYQLKI